MIENDSVEIDGKAISLDELIKAYKDAESNKSTESKAEIKRKNEQARNSRIS